MNVVTVVTFVGWFAMAVVAFSNVAKQRIILTNPDRDVCAQYTTPAGKALSCKKAGDVSAWILKGAN